MHYINVFVFVID